MYDYGGGVLGLPASVGRSRTKSDGASEPVELECGGRPAVVRDDGHQQLLRPDLHLRGGGQLPGGGGLVVVVVPQPSSIGKALAATRRLTSSLRRPVACKKICGALLHRVFLQARTCTSIGKGGN